MNFDVAMFKVFNFTIDLKVLCTFNVDCFCMVLFAIDFYHVRQYLKIDHELVKALHFTQP